MRADRLVSLALLLQARGRMSAYQLADELEVSVRTIYRDISALNAAGIPVMAEPGRGGGCRLIEGYRFPLRGLSADEAEALLLLGVTGVFAELGLADALAAAHRKVSTSAGLSAGGGETRQASLVHLDMPRWFHGTEPVPHLRTLAEAVRRRRCLLLGYRRDDSSREKTREVGPLGLVNKAGTWYLVATSSGGRVSVFRAGRIASATILDEPSDRPVDFDLALFWDRWSAEFTTSRPRLPVRLRASPQALAAFGEIFGDDARPVLDAAEPPDELGWQTVTLSFEHELAAAYRLAGFGGRLEVLSPPSVRALLVAAAQGILDRYGSPALFAALEHKQRHADDR